MFGAHFPCVQQYLFIIIPNLLTLGFLVAAAVDLGVLVIVSRGYICNLRDGICCSRVDICVSVVWFATDRRILY